MRSKRQIGGAPVKGWSGDGPSILRTALLPTPTKAAEVDAAPGIEADTLLLEQYPLGQLRPWPRPQADAASGVDHAMPWDSAAAGKGVEGVADLPGSTREPRPGSYLAIGRHTAAGDAAHDGVDPLVGGIHAHAGSGWSRGGSITDGAQCTAKADLVTTPTRPRTRPAGAFETL